VKQVAASDGSNERAETLRQPSEEDHMTEATVRVPEIHCDHCKSSLEGAIGELDGVSRVMVDVPTATIAVAYEEPVTMDSIIATIEGQGYEVPKS
jgi:copper chaperone